MSRKNHEIRVLCRHERIWRTVKRIADGKGDHAEAACRHSQRERERGALLGVRQAGAVHVHAFDPERIFRGIARFFVRERGLNGKRSAI